VVVSTHACARLAVLRIYRVMRDNLSNLFSIVCMDIMPMCVRPECGVHGCVRTICMELRLKKDPSGGRIPPGFIFFGCCEYNIFFLVVVSTHVCAFSSTAFIFWLL
jgi:hypothetical protein